MVRIRRLPLMLCFQPEHPCPLARECIVSDLPWIAAESLFSCAQWLQGRRFLCVQWHIFRGGCCHAGLWPDTHFGCWSWCPPRQWDKLYFWRRQARYYVWHAWYVPTYCSTCCSFAPAKPLWQTLVNVLPFEASNNVGSRGRWRIQHISAHSSTFHSWISCHNRCMFLLDGAGANNYPYSSRMRSTYDIPLVSLSLA